RRSPPLLNRHRFLFFPLSPFLPQSNLTPFAFVGLFAFLLQLWSLDLEFSFEQFTRTRQLDLTTKLALFNT
ncbi:hypothetical protein N7445_000966, partial [Penicillium cf. griseofulvum]